MRAGVWLLLPLVASLGCAKPKSSRDATRTADRRETFAGVSVLVPAGVAWWRAPRGERMSATWGGSRAPWCDIDEVTRPGRSERDPRASAEREWKSYAPALRSWHPGVKIPSPAWSSLGSNPYYAVRFHTARGAEMATGLLVVGDRLVMVTSQGPRPGETADPAAAPALERLAASIRPTGTSVRYE